MRFQKSRTGQYLKDMLAVAAMIIAYKISIAIAYDTIQYLNIRKIIWGSIEGLFFFVPMYAILWIFLRKAQSELSFFMAALSVWIVMPVLTSLGRSKTFNAWQGNNQIYENGELTSYGYVHKLQSPFFFLVLYAAALLAAHLYIRVQTQ